MGPPRAARRIEGAATEKDIDGPKWTGLDVGSPFQHGSSGLLYAARHLRQPGRDHLQQEYLDEIEGLVNGAGGRALGLFSSTRAAKAATDALRDKLDHPILCQGDDSTGLLVKKFSEDERTCLFGTLSLWQGGDVPGPVRPAGDHGPDPVPKAGRHAGLRAPESRQLQGEATAS